MTIVKKFLFSIERDKKTLLLVDLSAAKSGELMKNLDYVAPEKVAKFQKIVKEGDFKVGDYLEIDSYVFFFVRKHYRSKFVLKDFVKVAGNLPYEYNYKTTNESEKLAPYLEVLLNIYDRIEVYKTSNWNKRNKLD